MSDLTKNVLERMKKLFDDSYIPATMREESREELTIDVLCTLHSDMGYRDDEIMGDFFFVEMADGSMIFNSIMTLSEELDPNFVFPLSAALSKINPYLGLGCFVTDISDSRLSYKLSIPVSSSLTEDEVYDQVDLCVGHALSICEKYSSILLDVSTGDATAEEAISLAVDMGKEK